LAWQAFVFVFLKVTLLKVADATPTSASKTFDQYFNKDKMASYRALTV
jgi:hypothetical protein